MRRTHRSIEPRPIVADESNMGTALQTSRRQCSGQRGGLLCQFAPCHGTPDAALFFPQGRTFAALLRMVKQKLRESIQFYFFDRHLPSFSKALRPIKPPDPPPHADKTPRDDSGSRCR